MPRWLSLLFVLVMGVMVYEAGRSQRVSDGTSPVMVNERAYPEISKFTDVEHWKESLNPDYAKAMQACAPVEPPEGTLGIKVSVDALGAGPGAQCGEAVSLHLTRWDAKGEYEDETDVTLTLGQSGIAGLDSALLELRTGGERTVIIPVSEAKAGSPLRPFIPANKLNVVTFSRPEAEPEEAH